MRSPLEACQGQSGKFCAWYHERFAEWEIEEAKIADIKRPILAKAA